MFAAGVLENMAGSMMVLEKDYTYDSHYAVDMGGLSPTVSAGTSFEAPNVASFDLNMGHGESSYIYKDDEREMSLSEEAECFSDICSLEISDGESGCNDSYSYVGQYGPKYLSEALENGEDSTAIDDLKNNLNLMRDLNDFTGDGQVGKSKVDETDTRQILESREDSVTDIDLFTTDREMGYLDTPSDDTTIPNFIHPRSTSLLEEKKVEGSPESSAEPIGIDDNAVLSLSTPPATPVLKSSSIGTKNAKKTKRSHLLIDNSFRSNHTDAKNFASDYTVVLKFTHRKSDYVEHVKKTNSNLHRGRIITSNELVPISILKMNPKYTMTDMRQKQQLESTKDVPFNLDYVKTLSNSKKDRYYSRLNIFELSKILDLDRYDISLTKEIEVNILEIFKNYCNFKLGYQTWIRDTTKQERTNLISTLFSFTHPIYPEFDKFKLEVIVRRGSYSLMQSRLRKERRLKN